MPLFEVSLKEYTPSVMLKEVAYFCLTDCTHYYTYINNILKPLLSKYSFRMRDLLFFLGEFFNFSFEDTILLYELYSEHVLITRKLECFVIIADKLKGFQLKDPELYKIDVEYNSKIELYVKQLRANKDNIDTARAIHAHDTVRIVSDAFLNSNAALSERQAIFMSPRLQKNNAANSPRQNHEPMPSIRIEIADQENESEKKQDKQIKKSNLLQVYLKGSSQNDITEMQSQYPFVPSQGSFLKDDISANNSPIHTKSSQGEIP